MERKFDGFMDEIRGTIQGLSLYKSPTEPDNSLEIGDDEYLTGKQVKQILQKELPKITRELTTKEQENRYNAQKLYEGSYLKTFENMADVEDLDESMFKEVEKVMVEKFNVNHSKGRFPESDAQINFYRALRFVEKTKSGNGKNPLKGGKPPIPFGVAGGTKGPTKETAPVKLDEYAADFVKWAGMDDNAVREALTKK